MTLTLFCRSHWPLGLRRRSAGRWPAEIVGSNPPGHGRLSVVSVVCVLLGIGL